MDTLQRKPSEAIDTRVQTLERRGRWLLAALALVLVAGAVAIGWLVVENRSLSSDLDAAVYPLEAELTAREQHMMDVVDRYWVAWEADDFETIMEMYSPTAVHVTAGTASSNEDGRLRRTLEAWRDLGIADIDVVRVWVVGSNAFSLTDNPSWGLMVTQFTFGSGAEPLIERTE